MIRTTLFESGRKEILRGLLEGLDESYQVRMFKYVVENDPSVRPEFVEYATVEYFFYLGIQLNFRFLMNEFRDINAVVVFKDTKPLFGWYGDFSNEFSTEFVLTLLVEL